MSFKKKSRLEQHLLEFCDKNEIEFVKKNFTKKERHKYLSYIMSKTTKGAVPAKPDVWLYEHDTRTQLTSFEDIAKDMGIGVDKVKRLYKSAMEKLSKIESLKEYFD